MTAHRDFPVSLDSGCSALAPQERHTAGMAPLLAADLRAMNISVTGVH